VDQARGTEEETVLTQLSERERVELRLIDEALARLASGEYGRCEDCDEPIERERLAVVPEARLCLGCGLAAEKR
jgi:DnaK suppressor protein